MDDGDRWQGSTPEKIKLNALNGEDEEFTFNSPLRGNDEGAVAVKTDDEFTTEERGTWGSKLDFLLSTIGFAVDLSNVFRFPYLCYRNGGGAFLIPYFIMLVVGSLPLFYLEVILGQYQRSGCLTIWKISPIFKGIGWATCLMNFYVAIYYNAVISWAFYYLFASFTSVLPWTLCNEWWNSIRCYTIAGNHTNYTMETTVTTNLSTQINGSMMSTINPKLLKISSAIEYFEYEVLRVQNSDGFHDIGPPNWRLTLCLLLVFICLYFSLFKGVKSMGKAVWITAILPYIVLGVLLVRGVLLDGAKEGILYFIRPNFQRISDPVVWCDAAIQIFYSAGAGFGVHMAYSSYNNFNNNVYRDCLIASAVNSFTSLFSGFVVFAYLGYMAAAKEMSIDQVVNDSPGLVFMVYPEALATLPGAQFWSVLFFIMLISLGLDSSFGALEAMITAIRDELIWYFRKWGKYNRELLTLIFVIVIFICAIPNVCFGGIYVIQFLDSYGAGVTLLVSLWLQNVAVAWFYGLPKLSSDHEEMLGYKPNLYWLILWKFITPVVIFAVIIARFATLRTLTLDLIIGTYQYPWWAKFAGLAVIMSSLVMIPLMAIIQTFRIRADSWRVKFALLISPVSEHDEIRQSKRASRLTLRHWIRLQ